MSTARCRLRRRDRRTRIGVPLPELNLGSGFDVPCFRRRASRSTSYRMAKALHETLCNGARAARDHALSLELGRWLVGEAGVYLTRVSTARRAAAQTFLTTDGGGHHLLGATGMPAERGRGNFPIAVANRFGAPARSR